MIRFLATKGIAAVLMLIAGSGFAQQASTAPVAPAKGSTAFCLYELPLGEDGKRRWLNLGIVQYLELGRNELRIYYGGGNLGSGYEARLPVANTEELDALLEKIKQTAANCR